MCMFIMNTNILLMLPESLWKCDVHILLQANSAGANGNLESARSQNNLSIGCTVTGAVSTVVGIGVIIGIIFASAASSSQQY